MEIPCYFNPNNSITFYYYKINILFNEIMMMIFIKYGMLIIEYSLEPLIYLSSKEFNIGTSIQSF